MKKKTLIKIVISILLLFVIIFISSKFESTSASKTHEVEKKSKEISEDVYTPNEKDIIIGDKNAKVTVIEYGSFTCTHCSGFFNKNFDKLKRDYISKNKIRFIHRSVVADIPSLKATQFLNCQKKNHDTYLKLLSVLYYTQSKWAFTQSKFIDNLEHIISMSGFDSKEFYNCLADRDGENEILKDRLKMLKEYGITGTPTIYINNVKMEGDISYHDLQNVINKELSSK